MVTKLQILGANSAGLKHRNTNHFWSYHTPTLQVAYNMGLDGINLSESKDVIGYRFGKAPDTFISYNYSDNKLENGLSVYTEKSIVRSEFLGRKKYEYSGIVSGIGGDGEVLILSYEAEYLD